jgi:hypothetical protein
MEEVLELGDTLLGGRSRLLEGGRRVHLVKEGDHGVVHAPLEALEVASTYTQRVARDEDAIAVLEGEHDALLAVGVELKVGDFVVGVGEGRDAPGDLDEELEDGGVCEEVRRILLELLADREDPRSGKSFVKKATARAVLVDGDGGHVGGRAEVLEEAVDGYGAPHLDLRLVIRCSASDDGEGAGITESGTLEAVGEILAVPLRLSGVRVEVVEEGRRVRRLPSELQLKRRLLLLLEELLEERMQVLLLGLLRGRVLLRL